MDIPPAYDPGDAFQFDWSYEQLLLGGIQVLVKIAQFRLCHCRKPFCIAYNLCDEDRVSNEVALLEGDRFLSAYEKEGVAKYG